MSRRFTVAIRRNAQKQLYAIQKNFRLKIVIEIAKLAITPYPHGCKKLKGESGFWRIRVGDYRVIYTVADSVCIVEIHAVGHRQSVYKN